MIDAASLQAGARVAWYAPLGIAPARAVPRAGLASGLANHVARGFGARRRPRQALRGFTHFLESYNEEIYRLEPTPEAVARRLATTALRWWRPLEKMAREEEASLVARVLARLSTRPGELGDATFPECVLFLRAAVGAGALAADVPDETHEALDRFATALGLAWEATHGTLTAEGWRAGLSALGLPSSGAFAPLPDDASARARSHALAALAVLPASDAAARLAALVARPPLEPHLGVRKYAAYRPFFPELPTPEPSAAYLAQGPAGAFADRWRPSLEVALATYATSGSSAFRHAAAYLQRQKGKRVRGLLTLAAASACGIDPRRALGSAAAVEWLHQASLVLDDVVDHAATRRGSPTLHSVTNPLFAAAVAAFLLGRRREAASELPDSAGALLLDAELALLKGECLELGLAPHEGRTMSAYYRMIESKTARLFVCAASLGALAGPPDATEAAREAERTAQTRTLARYGREIGLAFQIVDDLLDYVGDDAALGKRAGTDFDNGRATLPLLLLEEASPVPAGADFAWICRTMRANAIPEACLERARRHVDAARAAVASLPGDEGREALGQLAESVVRRRS